MVAETRVVASKASGLECNQLETFGHKCSADLLSRLDLSNDKLLTCF